MYALQRAIRVLFLNLENYVDFTQESQNYLLRLPIIHCGLEIEHADYSHQRDLKTHGIAAADERALEAVRQFRPDVVVHSHTWRYGDLSPAFFRAVREMGPKIVSCIWDTFVFPAWAEIQLFQNADCLLIGDSLNTYLRLRSLAAIMKHPVTIGLCVGQYYIPDPQPPTEEQKVYDVTILGSLFGERLKLARYLEPRLAERGIKLHTIGGMYNEEQKELGYRETWLDWDSYAKIIRQSKICLSSQNDTQRLRVKGKVFEIAARGTLCLTDANRDAQRMLPADVIPLYTTFEDCFEKICFFRGRNDLRSEIERRAQRWVQDNFNSSHFYSGLLRFLVFGEGDCPTASFLDNEFRLLMQQKHLMLPAAADLVSAHIELLDREGIFPAAKPLGRD